MTMTSYQNVEAKGTGDTARRRAIRLRPQGRRSCGRRVVPKSLLARPWQERATKQARSILELSSRANAFSFLSEDAWLFVCWIEQEGRGGGGIR